MHGRNRCSGIENFDFLGRRGAAKLKMVFFAVFVASREIRELLNLGDVASLRFNPIGYGNGQRPLRVVCAVEVIGYFII